MNEREDKAARELMAIYKRLREYYTPVEAAQWLAAEQPQMHGERAIEVIEAGQAYRVHQILDRLDGGVYL